MVLFHIYLLNLNPPHSSFTYSILPTPIYCNTQAIILKIFSNLPLYVHSAVKMKKVNNISVKSMDYFTEENWDGIKLVKPWQLGLLTELINLPEQLSATCRQKICHFKLLQANSELHLTIYCLPFLLQAYFSRIYVHRHSTFTEVCLLV